MNEKQIAKILPVEITTNMIVEKIKIDKRQTNGKEDIVYAIIDIANEDVHRTSYYLLTINYYDKGGWVLDKWEKYQDSISYPLTPPNEDMAREILLESYNDFNMYFRSSDVADFKDGNSSFIFDVDKTKKYLTVTGDLTVNMSFSQYDERWIGYQRDIISNLVEEWKIIGEYTAKWDNYNGIDKNWKYRSRDESMVVRITQVNDNTVQLNGTIHAYESHKVREMTVFDSGYEDVWDHKISGLFEMQYDYNENHSDHYFRDGKKHLQLDLALTKDYTDRFPSNVSEMVRYHRLFFSEETACFKPSGFYIFKQVKKIQMETNVVERDVLK